MSYTGIAENLLSDFIFLGITLIVGFCIFRFTKRKKLLNFFGINESRRIAIYLSELKLEQGDAAGIDGKPYSYTGSAVAFGEMQSANKFRDLFNYFLPSLSDVPNFLSQLLISDVHVQLHRSPVNIGEIEHSASFITFGSPVYNLASKFVESKLHSKAKFNNENIVLLSPDSTTNGMGILGLVEATRKNPSPIPSGTPMPESPFGSAPEHLQQVNQTSINIEGVPPLHNSNYGFVERIIDHENKRTIFYVAGISELSTVGAAHFLKTQWEKLQQEFGNDKNFLIMLKFESSDYSKWTKIF